MRLGYKLAIGVAAVLVAGAMLVDSDTLIVAVSAPKVGHAMTIFLATDLGPLEDYRDLTAEYEIHYGDQLVYPPSGRGATFDVRDRRGTAVVPYEHFVIGNGEYDVLVRYGGEATRSRVTVDKWVEHVWLQPRDTGKMTQVETALSGATGARAEDRILARGEIILTVHYRGPDGRADRVLGQVAAETRNDRTSTDVLIPKALLSEGPGYYSFEPLFHNLEARNNVQVEGDPTMANRHPPSNWLYVS